MEPKILEKKPFLDFLPFLPIFFFFLLFVLPSESDEFTGLGFFVGMLIAGSALIAWKLWRGVFTYHCPKCQKIYVGEILSSKHIGSQQQARKYRVRDNRSIRYKDQRGLTSLKGTLVPAKNLNKLLSKIPVIGKIIIPDEIGEGLFGVSFKMKGLPGEIKTSINPIKTLTPRFITKALEKSKDPK